jgi:hypothetical protein
MWACYSRSGKPCVSRAAEVRLLLFSLLLFLCLFLLIAQHRFLLISYTNSAKLRYMSTTQTQRIAVEPGGCHGYQYKMELATPMTSKFRRKH